MTVNDLESIHRLTPVVGDLPGEQVPYLMPSGEGERHQIGDQLWTVVARSADSGGDFDAAFVLGPRGSGAPFHSVPFQRSFYVFDGAIQFWLPGESQLLGPGDSVHVPAGVPVAYRFAHHMSRFLLFSAPGGALADLGSSDTAVTQHIYRAGRSSDAPGIPAGWAVHDLPLHDASDTWDDTLPTDTRPYVQRAHTGDHRAWPDAVNTFSARAANTDRRYFSVTTLGNRQPYIPQHFHQLHTENFFCLSGRIWLWVNGTEVLLTPGDFVHAPPGTIHSYALGAHNTRMLGVLTTDVFEPFFDRTGVPTADNVYTEGLVDPASLMAKLGQISDLDVTMVGPPPVSAYSHL
ncbi:quercetin 2,3-dioxygenase [Gordonia sp. PKS22-38]|uniref:Quercetin 2,3-dioxygenase n=1 Tax=Gordonia prachuapensis TaxID=3115651 RepID=A0ABU7MXM0_9ACTN|nr:quercetin 2,3-dioxygenase [Gordonia sp. PKS22-38]